MIKTILEDDKGGKVFLSVLTLVAIVVPILHLLVPEGSAFHLSAYTVSLLGKYLCFALLALAVDLVWDRHPTVPRNP